MGDLAKNTGPIPENQPDTAERRPPKRERLDVLLVARGFFASRERAKRAIMAGEVKVGTAVADKPGATVPWDAPLRVAEPPPYVGRGGIKLAGALDHFGVTPAGQICLDVGASTGGFTDCLLQRGAARVYAVDVGHDQLDWKIRSDPRVIVLERVNARHLSVAEIPEPCKIAVIDVSFISLTLILPPVGRLLTRSAVAICLIKPQFELGREAVGKGGIVRDPALHREAVSKIERFVVGGDLGLTWGGTIESPIVGTSGNREFLACLRK
jgi:23S rRNA (cytidine1920-2'-O)/16S rRNA (cytidine1409-2'-O)-methyltransferase